MKFQACRDDRAPTGRGLAELDTAIAQAILWRRDHPDEARRMGQSGRDYVRSHYSRASQARLLEAILRQVAGGQSR